MMAQVMDELAKAVGALFCLRGVDLVPEIPGKERTAPAPALNGKGEARLDGLAGLLAPTHAPLGE
jgi:hypothetical protein